MTESRNTADGTLTETPSVGNLARKAYEAYMVRNIGLVDRIPFNDLSYNSTQAWRSAVEAVLKELGHTVTD